MTPETPPGWQAQREIWRRDATREWKRQRREWHLVNAEEAAATHLANVEAEKKRQADARRAKAHRREAEEQRQTEARRAKATQRTKACRREAEEQTQTNARGVKAPRRHGTRSAPLTLTARLTLPERFRP